MTTRTKDLAGLSKVTNFTYLFIETDTNNTAIMKLHLFIIATVILSIFATEANGQRPVRFNNESSDTTTITNILIELEKDLPDNQQNLVAMAGEKLINTSYIASTLEIEPEMLTINLDGLDCTTFVETATALAMTAASHRTSWRDFIYNLENIRYRSGKADGYPSRLHYVSDWIVDNSHRGNFQEMTSRIGRADFAIKTLDYITSHRSSYKALNDNGNYEKIKNVEIGYRSHRFPFIKPQNIKTAKIGNGDIIAITTSIKGLDVMHMGIATIIDGVPHLMHASSKAKKVIVDPLPLWEYLRKNRNATGIRVIRLKD